MTCKYPQICIRRKNPLDNFYPPRLSMVDRKETMHGLQDPKTNKPPIENYINYTITDK